MIGIVGLRSFKGQYTAFEADFENMELMSLLLHRNSGNRKSISTLVIAELVSLRLPFEKALERVNLDAMTKKMIVM